jgi:hypothetical protein
VPVPSTVPVGFADVAVTVGGAASNTKSFLVIPVITKKTPDSGVVSTPVTVTGTSFGPQQGSSTITFGGVPVAPTVWSDTSITAPLPDTSGLAQIVVTVNGFTTNGVPFPVVPNIAARQPGAAPIGTEVTISGAGFGPAPGTLGGVTFNGIAATIANWSTDGITAIVPAGASSGNIVVTTASNLTSSGVNFNIIQALSISAMATPFSNGARWNNTPVTVSFQCAGGLAPVTCPPSQTVNTEGANQVITGTASDSAGNTASASITINLDKTAPVISIASPVDGTSVTKPMIRLTGSISDTLSGIAAVSCNGSNTDLSGGSYVCNVPLVSGPNVIHVQGVDVAGNTTPGQVSVTYNPVTATNIFITPSLVNMVAGNTRSVKLSGELGQPISGATWKISDASIVAITTDDPPQLTALAQGTATLTASFSGLATTMTVKVFPGASLPFGTPLWSTGSITGGGSMFSVPANVVNPGDPDLYIVDGQSTLRGFTADGEQLWVVKIADGPPSGNAPSVASNLAPQAFTVSSAAGRNSTTLSTMPIQTSSSGQTPPDALQLQLMAQRRRIMQRMGQNTEGTQADSTSALAPQPATAAAAAAPTLVMDTLSDNDGNAVNLVFNCLDVGCNTFNPSFISIDNASQSQLWAQDLTQAGPFVSVAPFAIGPDNTIYAVGTFVLSRLPATGQVTKATTKIFAIDGATGSQKFALELPSVSQEDILLDRDGNKLQDNVFETGAGIGPISVMPDGSVQALLWTYHRSETQTQGTGIQNAPCPQGALQCTTAISNHQKLEWLTVQAGGSLSTQQMQTYDFDISGCNDCSDPGSATGFLPEQVIPDGFGGTLASWTKTSGTVNPFNKPPVQFLSRLGGQGGNGDIEMGTPFVPVFSGFGGNLVLGENNTVFTSAGPSIGAFDFVAKTQLWASAPVGGETFLIAATANGGLLTQKTSSRFGSIDAVLSFDSSGGSTVFSTTLGISYFDDNTFLGSPFGTEGLLSPPIPIVTDPSNLWFLPAGNRHRQRAPTRPQVTFDKKVVKAGISHISKDVRGTITATIKPKSAAPKVTFISTNKARATVSEESRIDGTDSTTVTLRITGVVATPIDKPKGDAQVQALFAGKKIGLKVPALVVVPTTQDHKIGQTTLVNTSGQMTSFPFKFVLTTDVTNIVSITISDQFGQILDSAYDGTDVVTETLSNASPVDCVSSGEQVIVIPDHQLRAGVKLDETGFTVGFAPNATVTPQQQQDWANQKPVFGHSNTFALGGQGQSCSLTQAIKVHGFTVTPDFHRNQVMLPQDQPPIPYTITDTPVSQ